MVEEHSSFIREVIEDDVRADRLNAAPDFVTDSLPTSVTDTLVTDLPSDLSLPRKRCYSNELDVFRRKKMKLEGKPLYLNPSQGYDSSSFEFSDGKSPEPLDQTKINENDNSILKQLLTSKVYFSTMLGDQLSKPLYDLERFDRGLGGSPVHRMRANTAPTQNLTHVKRDRNYPATRAPPTMNKAKPKLQPFSNGPQQPIFLNGTVQSLQHETLNDVKPQFVVNTIVQFPLVNNQTFICEIPRKNTPEKAEETTNIVEPDNFRSPIVPAIPIKQEVMEEVTEDVKGVVKEDMSLSAMTRDDLVSPKQENGYLEKKQQLEKPTETKNLTETSVKKEANENVLNKLLEKTLPNLLEDPNDVQSREKFNLLYYLHLKNDNETHNDCLCAPGSSILQGLLEKRVKNEVTEENEESEDEDENDSERPDTPTWLALYDQDADLEKIAEFASKTKKSAKKKKKVFPSGQRRHTFSHSSNRTSGKSQRSGSFSGRPQRPLPIAPRRPCQSGGHMQVNHTTERMDASMRYMSPSTQWTPSTYSTVWSSAGTTHWSAVKYPEPKSANTEQTSIHHRMNGFVPKTEPRVDVADVLASSHGLPGPARRSASTGSTLGHSGVLVTPSETLSGSSRVPVPHPGVPTKPSGAPTGPSCLPVRASLPVAISALPRAPGISRTPSKVSAIPSMTLNTPSGLPMRHAVLPGPPPGLIKMELLEPAVPSMPPLIDMRVPHTSHDSYHYNTEYYLQPNHRRVEAFKPYYQFDIYGQRNYYSNAPQTQLIREHDSNLIPSEQAQSYGQFSRILGQVHPSYYSLPTRHLHQLLSSTVNVNSREHYGRQICLGAESGGEPVDLSSYSLVGFA